MAKVEVEVYSPCKEELKPTLERFIESVFFSEEELIPELYAVDESSEKEEIEGFWNKVADTDSIPPILFMKFSGAEPQGSLQFLKSGIERWETWNPTGSVPLKHILRYLLKAEKKR